MRFRAIESISVERPEFVWRASVGPLGCVSVVDAFRDGEATLAVRALNWVRLARVQGGEAAAKGEIMRYLAELAWAPDALVRNRALEWTAVDEHTLRVAAGRGLARGEVELRLNEDGRIGWVSAEDRPRKEGGGFVERPWRGRYTDYRGHHGRWLPFAGEVGWVLEDRPFIAWQGRLVEWAVEEG